jgi:hypothetical protein
MEMLPAVACCRRSINIQATLMNNTEYMIQTTIHFDTEIKLTNVSLHSTTPSQLPSS